MRRSLLTLFLLAISAFLLSFTIYKTSRSLPAKQPEKVVATCYGYKSCNACKNCKYCKHCAKDGGTCGVCK
ncbi:MAG TPA: hypothetical protein VK644_12465 [Chitinophagaceae bacterium]|nr:hypothetical protein [Chitinophagaceae bacterium]